MLLQIVQILAHCLVGNLDGAVFRYILLMADFVALVDWRRVEDFRSFAGAVYPFSTVSTDQRMVVYLCSSIFH